MRAGRTTGFLAFAIAVPLVWASTAWACFVAGSDPFVTVSPSRAPAGSTVTVTGRNWAPHELEVRWGSPTGRIVASAAASPQDGRFSIAFAVPRDERLGTHYVYVVQPDSSPTKADAVEIIAARGATDEANDPSPAPRTAASTSGATPGAPGEGPTPVEADSPVQPMPTGDDIPAARPSARSAPPPATAAARSEQPARTSSATVPGVGTISTQPRNEPTPAAPAPSAASASGDLWPGFADDGRSPGLVDPGLVVPRPSASNEHVVAGGLLLAGLLALAAGFGAGELSRRRAAAGGRSS